MKFPEGFMQLLEDSIKFAKDSEVSLNLSLKLLEGSIMMLGYVNLYGAW